MEEVLVAQHNPITLAKERELKRQILKIIEPGEYPPMGWHLDSIPLEDLIESYGEYMARNECRFEAILYSKYG